MGNRPHFYDSTTLTNTVESAANTETVVCTCSGISTEFAGQTLKIRGWAKVTTTGSTSAGILRIRRTSLTGTLVSEATAENQQFAATKTCESTIIADDTPGDLAGAVYVLTFQATAGAAAATFLAASLDVRVD